MPIRADLRHFYGKEWLMITRPRILERAGHCCEDCGRPNRVAVITRTWKDAEGHCHMAWRRTDSIISTWWDEHGERFNLYLPSASRKAGQKPAACQKTVFVRLAIAHLNHTPGDDRDENLRALCGWCHLHHDQPHHQATREVRKDSGRPMLQEAP